MKKRIGSLVLALALCLGLAVPASALSLPMATPEVSTSVAHISTTLEEYDAEGYPQYVDYIFVIDQQGVLWQYKSGVHGFEAPISDWQKKQVAGGVIQIGAEDFGIGVLKSGGTLSYYHVDGEETLYELASGVACLQGETYLTQQGELWFYYWDLGGAHIVTEDGVKREREPGLKQELLASDVISFSGRDMYVTAGHVLHDTSTLRQVQSVYSGSGVYFAIDANGGLYSRGLNTYGYVGNGGTYNDQKLQWWGDLPVGTPLPLTLTVDDMEYIMGNVEDIWVSDAVYALDRDGNIWTWGDLDQPATATLYSAPPEKYDTIIQQRGNSYYAVFANYPRGKDYASPRKMETGERVSMLAGYRQDANGTIYATLDEREYALPHTGGVLGGKLNFAVGESLVSDVARTTAYASTQNVLVDGEAVEFPCYALKDANGNDTNYIKLRDVAQILNGTSAQFAVIWDGAVNIVTGQPYTANGSEMNTPFSGDRPYTVPTSETRVNGQTASLDAIVLTDDAGNGYTYYKLRDLGAALGFTVDWSADKGIFIETT